MFYRRLLSRVFLPARTLARAWRNRPISRATGISSAILAQPPLRMAPDCRLAVIRGDLISDSILDSGVWEEELSLRLLDQAKTGGLLVEVGANLGYFSILWASAKPNNLVYAMEPSQRNLRLLRYNVESNGLSGRIHVLPVAGAKSLGLVQFDSGPTEQTGWGGFSTAGQTETNTTTVVAVPLDGLLAEDAQISVLKIDVEGADTWVLQGARNLLLRLQIRRVFYEQNHPRMAALGISSSTAKHFLAEVGYETRPLTPEGHDVVEWEAWPRHAAAG